MTQKMWEYKCPVSGHPSVPFGEITEVEVTVGRKYFNLPYPGGEWSGYRRQYTRELNHDSHGIPYYEEHSEYSTEYLLFETKEAAERRKEYDEIGARLNSKGMHDKIAVLPMEVLSLIEQCLDKKVTDVLPAEFRKISVPLKDGLGELYAEVGGDTENYPEIYTFVRRPDGLEIDVAAVGGTEDGVRVYLYKDTTTECYTDSFDLSKEDLLIEAD